MTLHPLMASLMRRAGHPLPPADPETPSAPTRWDTLYATVYRHDVTPTQRIAAVRAVGHGIPSRGAQLAAYERSHPIAAETQPSFETWVLDWRNDINRRLGKPTYTLAESRTANPLQVSNSATGLGDTVVSLYAVCGLAKATGRPVVYHARSHDWLVRVSFPGVTIRPHADLGPDISGGWDGPYGYNQATASAPSRLWAYCKNLSVAFGVPEFEPARPSVDRSAPTRQRSAYAVLAPFTSGWPAREWPAAKWTEVAHGLAARGIRPIGIGSSNQRDRLDAILPGYEYHYGTSPAAVIDLMLGASVVIGNDSGIVHMAGLLGVSAIAVHAGSLPHEYLFALAPSVRSVVVDRAVSRSDANHDVLCSIPSGAVLAAAFPKASLGVWHPNAVEPLAEPA